MKKFTLLLLVLLAGCRSNQPVDTNFIKTLTKTYAVVITYTPSNEEIDVSHSRDNCPYKNNDWMMTHGDGHKSKCSNCVPSWYPTSGNCVGPNCDCGDDCKCDYQNQCSEQATLEKPIITLSAEDRAKYFELNRIKWNTPNGKCCPNCASEKCHCLFIGQSLLEKGNGVMPNTGFLWPKSYNYVEAKPEGEAGFQTFDFKQCYSGSCK